MRENDEKYYTLQVFSYYITLVLKQKKNAKKNKKKNVLMIKITMFFQKHLNIHTLPCNFTINKIYIIQFYLVRLINLSQIFFIKNYIKQNFIVLNCAILKQHIQLIVLSKKKMKKSELFIKQQKVYSIMYTLVFFLHGFPFFSSQIFTVFKQTKNLNFLLYKIKINKYIRK